MPQLGGPVGVNGYTGLTQQVRLILESTSGEQLLLPATAGAATMSLTTQPDVAFTTTTGCQLHFYIIGNPTAGTIVIVGTNAAGGAQTSQTYHIDPAPQNAQGYSEFTTTEVWQAVTAASITLTTLTPCQIMVFGSPAGKYLLPMTADAEEKIAKHSPPDKRGILFKNLRVTQLTKSVSLDKFDADLYPDSLWALYMLITNNPTVTTVPATPTTLLAVTLKAATMTLTTAPVKPGEFLIFAITGNTAAGTIVLSGTDQYGNVAIETLIASSAATQTLYSSKRYSALTAPGANQFTTTGLTGSSIAVTGVYAWTYTGIYDGLTNLGLSSASLEIWDGVIPVKLPYTILTDGTFDWQKEKEVLFTGKGEAQDYLILGDPNPTTYPAGTNNFATLAQPTSLPMVSWPGSYYIDALPGTPGTTADGSLTAFKLHLSTGQKFYYVGDGMQRPSDVTRTAEPDWTLDATLIFQSYQYYLNYFKPNQKIALQAAFQGALLGSIGSTTYYENWTWTLPGKINTWKPDMSKNPVEVVANIMSEYDFGLGYAYKLAITCQVPPTYTS